MATERKYQIIARPLRRSPTASYTELAFAAMDDFALVDNSLILPSGKDKLEWFLTQYRKHYTITGGEPTTKFNGVFLARSWATESAPPPSSR